MLAPRPSGHLRSLVHLLKSKLAYPTFRRAIPAHRPATPQRNSLGQINGLENESTIADLVAEEKDRIAMDRRRRNVVTNLGMLSVTALGLAAASTATKAQGVAKASQEQGAGARAKLLAGKTAVITGAARGIGRATAVAFAREGADIVGVDICAVVDPRSGVTPSTPEELDETGKLVSAAGRRWLGMKTDTRDLSALRAAASRAEQEFGGVDILFANAGIQSFHPLLEMEDADWTITIETN